jgi:hypothetical protein
VSSFGLESSETLEAILRHGLVDLVPGKSSRLMRGLYGSIGDPKEKIDTPEEQLLDSSAAEELRKSPRKSVLAAMALVAAARHEADPFANPVYLKLAHQSKDDPRIPALAVGLWIEIVGMSGSPPDFRVTHAGLPAIWDRALARKEQDAGCSKHGPHLGVPPNVEAAGTGIPSLVCAASWSTPSQRVSPLRRWPVFSTMTSKLQC